MVRWPVITALFAVIADAVAAVLNCGEKALGAVLQLTPSALIGEAPEVSSRLLAVKNELPLASPVAEIS